MCCTKDGTTYSGFISWTPRRRMCRWGERIEDQAEYFGVAVADVPRGGVMASQFTRDKLSGRELTVVTRWQNAMGRSRQARFYGIVLVQGKPGDANDAPGPGWVRLAEASRPNDKTERYRLYRAPR